MSTPSSNKPVLSIITPVFNGQRHIAAALRSVRQASAAGASVEHIIMDAASTDRTMDIVESERRLADSPITHVVSQQDEGQADAINRGFALASGRYLAWLNADDIYVSAKLCEFVATLEDSEADVVLGRCEFVDQKGRVVFAPVPPDPVTPASLLSLLTGWYAGRSIVQPEAFIARRAFEAAGNLETSLHYTMDHEYWLRLALGGATYESHDTVVARQLVHAGQKTADNAAVVREQVRYSLEAIRRSPERFESDLDAVGSEIGLLESRLRLFDGVLAVLDQRSSAVVAPWPVSEAADASVLRELADRCRNPQSVLCVGLTQQEVRRVVSELRPKQPPVVVGRAAKFPRVFDAIVSRAAGFGSGCTGRLSQSLLPGGSLAVLGELDSTRAGQLVQSIRTELANRLTWAPRDHSLKQAADWVRKNRSAVQLISAHNLTVSSCDAEYAKYYPGHQPHALSGLAGLLGLQADSEIWRSTIYRPTSVTRT